MDEKNTARIRGEVFEFGRYAGYTFGIGEDGTATIAVKYNVSDPLLGLKIAKRLEDIRQKAISSASEAV